jgi:hypothetical protein
MKTPPPLYSLLQVWKELLQNIFVCGGGGGGFLKPNVMTCKKIV